VLRTVTALNDAGFTGGPDFFHKRLADLCPLDITMYESSIRPHDVYQLPRPITVSEIIARVKAKEISNEERRLRQIQASRQQNRKRKRQGTGEEPDEDEPLSKRRKDDVEEAAQEGTDDLEAGRAAEPSITPCPKSRIENTDHKVPMSKPISEVRGHTSYLTFAVLLPLETSIVAPELGERAMEMTTKPQGHRA
jgi:tRNA (adenine57-N1/adenine58-N1)-methyltransferase